MQPGHEEVALASKEEELLAEILDESSSFAQEMMVRLKRNRERIMSICLIRFLIGYFRRTLSIPQFVEFYKESGRLRKGNVQGSKRKRVTKLPCKYYINIFYQLRITQYPTPE